MYQESAVIVNESEQHLKGVEWGLLLTTDEATFLVLIQKLTHLTK